MLAFLSLFLVLGYWWMMGQYLYFWAKIPKKELGFPATRPFLSVLIAFRNEAQTLPACLRALAQQDYPPSAYELICVDDHSQDDTLAQIAQLGLPNLQVLQLPAEQKGKKAALALAATQARGQLWLFTDADCLPPPTWLSGLAQAWLETQADCLCAPVHFDDRRGGLLARFQALDFLGMMLLTGAGLQGGFQHLANGANWAYTPQIYQRARGFEGLQHRASGDDVMLLQKMRSLGAKVVFLPQVSLLMPTQPAPTWMDLLRQRLRWAGKNGEQALQNWGNTWRSAWVFGLCTAWVVGFLGLFWGLDPWFWLVLALGKLLGDLALLWPATAHFERRDLRWFFLPSYFVHTIYVFTIGSLSLFFKHYHWKGRVSR